MSFYKNAILVFSTALLMYACAPADGDYTGSEYMPDMAHSIAVEANVYTNYSLNTWDEESTVDLKSLSIPRKPVEGTIPRGYAGYQLSDNMDAQREMMESLRGERAVNEIAVPLNGNVPYHYGDNDEERLRATAELINNPFPISADGLERGKELYNIFCGICHGEKGDGLGYLANSDENPNAKYLAVPANFLNDEFLAASNGRYYHAIMYGKNVMGAYRDKMSFEERWQVIHYIRALQAKEKKLAYNEDENTLNPSFGTPMGNIEQLAATSEDNTLQGQSHDNADHQTDGDHSSDASHGGSDHGDGDHNDGSH